jgi:hypothetical protein
MRWRPELMVHDTLELGSAAAAVLRGIPYVTHGYGPMIPDTRYFAGAIGAAIAEAGLPDPVPAVFAAPYLDVCPPGLRGTQPYPWPVTHPLRPTAGELDPRFPVEIDLAGLPHQETVYATLGMVMNQAPAVFRAVIDGCVRHRVNLMLTTGPDFDVAQLGSLPPAVRTAPFLPQAAVLPHFHDQGLHRTFYVLLQRGMTFTGHREVSRM